MTPVAVGSLRSRRPWSMRGTVAGIQTSAGGNLYVRDPRSRGRGLARRRPHAAHDADTQDAGDPPRGLHAARHRHHQLPLRLLSPGRRTAERASPTAQVTCAGMDFAPSPRTLELRERLQAFVDERLVDRRSPSTRRQVAESGDPHFHPPVMEELKAEARERGLWNLFLPDAELRRRAHQPRVRAAVRAHGHVAAARRRPPTAPRPTPATWRSSPSSARRSSRSSGCDPLLDGEIRSCFAMTEPWVASSRRHQHPEPHRARRRPLRDQRAQVVHERRGSTRAASSRSSWASPIPTPTRTAASR